MLSPPLLFPSDLPYRGEGEFRLAGRVLASAGATLYLADALATVRLSMTGADPGDVAEGDLVVARVAKQEQTETPLGVIIDGPLELRAMAIVERHRPTSPRGADRARFLTGGVAGRLRARALLMQRIRAFFEARAFVEVETPTLVPSPGSDLHLAAVETRGGFLITSPEYQMKRLLVGGLPRIFQIAHVFREGEVGERHNPEFAMLEWYRAFAGMADVMRDTEELIFELAVSLAGTAALNGPHGPVDVRPPFEKLTVAQAFARHAAIDQNTFFTLAESDEDRFFRVLVEQVEPALAAYPRPVFLVEYPISQASLARAKPDDPRVCERFELYLGGIELCNGFGELTDPIEQRRRLAADQLLRSRAGKPVYPIDERFVASLEEGMPPAAGNALGLDRLVALCLGERSISGVIAFPEGHL
jgi:lysyl-tRNA synthetase class 2